MNTITVSIAYAESSHRQHEVTVAVPKGTTMQQGLVLLAADIALLLNGQQAAATGVWGKVRPPHYRLRDGDRIEIYRQLQAEPKQARRARTEPDGPPGRE